MTYRSSISALTLLLAWQGFAIEPKGIVYESEAISTPVSAWTQDKRVPGQWMLWTREDKIEEKRSGTAVLASPAVAEDRETPEAGAPPLHSVVTDLEPGTYLVYASAPGARPLAYSLDGETWQKHHGRELLLGIHHIPDGRFELWVDDRYAYPPGNPGSGYYDYLRFVRVPDSARHVRRMKPSPALEKEIRANDDAFVVPATETTAWKGFTPDREWLKAGSAGHSFEYEFDREGTFYVALSMVDDADGVEQLTVHFNGDPIGCAVADQAAAEALFSLEQPVNAKPGDRLTFTCETSVGYYRVGKLYFAPEFIVPPPPAVRYVEAWSPAPGTADLCWTTESITATGRVEYGVDDFARVANTEPYEGRNHRIRLNGLDPAQTYQARIVNAHEGRELFSETIHFQPTPKRPATSKALSIPITVPEPTETVRSQWPATIGMPFAQGALATVDDLTLTRTDGESVPLQADPFSRWPDGSVKWALLSWQADTTLNGQPGYVLKTGGAAGPTAPDLVQIDDQGVAWRVETGTISFDVGKQMPALFHRVGVDQDNDGTITDNERITRTPLGANVRLVDGDGTTYTCGPPAGGRVTMERNGPVEAAVAWSGDLVKADGTPGWAYRVRVRLWKDLPVMAVTLTVIHDEPQPNFKSLSSLALRVPLDGDRITGNFDRRGLEPVPDKDGLWLHQPKDNQFTLRLASGEQTGERAEGVAVAEGHGLRATVLLRDFWETYPSGYAIKSDGVHVRLLPELAPDTYQSPEDKAWFYKLYAWSQEGDYLVRAGQATRHEVFVHYGATGSDSSDLAAWLRNPLIPQAPPEYLCATGVLGRSVFPRTAGVWDDYESYFDASFENLLEDRERRRTYGWMHFGDWFGERYANYGNNEYALDWALGVHWMRTGDRRAFDRGLEMARHYATIDTQHGDFTEQRNGIVWTHCFNHVGTPLPVEDLHVPDSDAGMKKSISTATNTCSGAP